MPLLPSTRPTTSDVFFGKHNVKIASLAATTRRQRGPLRHSAKTGATALARPPRASIHLQLIVHVSYGVLGFGTQGCSHGLRLFYRSMVTGHLRPMCPRRRWPSAPSLRPAVKAATGWFPPEGLLRHSALGGLRQPTPSARDTRSWLRPAATTESLARG